MKYTVHDYVEALYDVTQVANVEELNIAIREFIEFVYKNHDQSKLNSIIRDFDNYYSLKHNSIKVMAEVVHEPSLAGKKEIENCVLRITGVKKLNIDYVLNKDILGGIRIKTSNLLIDATMKGHIEELKNTII